MRADCLWYAHGQPDQKFYTLPLHLSVGLALFSIADLGETTALTLLHLDPDVQQTGAADNSVAMKACLIQLRSFKIKKMSKVCPVEKCGCNNKLNITSFYSKTSLKWKKTLQ